MPPLSFETVSSSFTFECFAYQNDVFEAHYVRLHNYYCVSHVVRLVPKMVFQAAFCRNVSSPRGGATATTTRWHRFQGADKIGQMMSTVAGVQGQMSTNIAAQMANMESVRCRRPQTRDLCFGRQRA